MHLRQLRKKIDRLDRQIVGLIERRVLYALQTKNLKSELTDRNREEEVFRNYAETYSGLLTSVFRKGLAHLLVDYSRDLQAGNRLLVGFQGWWGAFSQQAALCFLPAAQTVPLQTFYQLLSALAKGAVHYAVFPVFNSTTGWIESNLNLLNRFRFECSAQIAIPIKHFLFAIEEIPLEKLKKVYAHPQALKQCQRFIQKYGLRGISCSDGAITAAKIWQNRTRRVAVIGGSLLVNYGLKILEADVQDNADNHTLFYLLRSPDSAFRFTE